ncbi:D-alanyl-D-alanine carboxypeptidase [Vibrio breoganii]|uniref:serine-type D-Ala-D-Ala carboxypeptidase n=1 Tax=Vibrio breoganii TaxID=553239 RepID=A0AAN0XTL0_9VIBR|nr:D-alanyl-D-alanine carboxypeptidase family protein [Vibrio breoganii]ANO32411.1 D-alanyl-D-alanine carboxypeptidase [Vibrio breoganii]OED91335.1 D-alanyl-D-alanine carboxypeptidase [Vibrio breoganii ZF-55]PML02651.1 D-alanyl-D-alanine carboxypeptidase [Vibrio breoganii]
MKRRLNGLTLTLLASLSFSVFAAPIAIPNPPSLSAKGYVLLDYHSGEVIAEHNPHTQLKPASLTKLMTSYTAGQELNRGNIAKTDQVTISREAWARNFPDSSKMFIEVGNTVEFSDLLRGLIVQSGNDASVAIAEHVAGSQAAFVDLMNNWARRLQLNDTYFANPHGLDDPNQATTAYDMAKLGQALIRDVPTLFPLYSETSFTYNGITQHNRNALLRDRSMNVDGMKTGYTQGAGYSLVSTATQGDMRLISVVMGTSSPNVRTTESKSLLNYGFRFFETIQPHEVGAEVTETRIWMGEENQVSLGIAEDVYMSVRRGSGNNIRAEVDLPSTLKAPIAQGETLGSVNYIDENNQVLKTVPLVALNDVEQGGFFKRIFDYIRLMFI